MQIPQNENNYIKIEFGDWKNSVDYLIKNHEEINLFNLFMIIKLKLSNKKYSIISLLIISKKNETYKDVRLYKNTNINAIKKLNYTEFIEWFEDLVIEIWKYIKDEEFFGFRFLINPLIKLDDLKLTIPRYPWDSEDVKIFYEKKISKSSKILELLNENKKLKLKIKELENRIK